MHLNAVRALVFTGAGTTRAVAERFVQACGLPGTVVDITPRAFESMGSASEATVFAPDDLAVFAVPSYGGRVPVPAIRRFACCQGSDTPAVLLVTYGNRAVDDTFLELADTVSTQGFVPVAAGAIVAHHSLMVNVAEGRPDDEDLARVDALAQTVLSKLADAPSAPAAALAEIPGEQPYRDFGGVPFHPEADAKRCIACGACAHQCPTGAIAEDDPTSTDADLCISCMRCIAACPVGARAIAGGAALAAARAAFGLKCAQRRESYLLV